MVKDKLPPEPEDDDDEEEEDALPAIPVKNYMTPGGFAVLQEEMRVLVRDERPRVVEIISWAAGNGDRSENGDYIYGKKRLREIDRRLRFLTRNLKSAVVVDPKKQAGLQKVFFGATVTYIGADDIERTVMLVGIDEADVNAGKINWQSPVALALMKHGVGDEVKLSTINGTEIVEIVSITYT